MKLFKFLPLVVVLGFCVVASRIHAAWIDQPLSIVVVGPFQTNSMVVTNHLLGKTVEINETNVVKAIVQDLGGLDTNNPAHAFYTWHLYYRVDTNSGEQSIIIRNLQGSTNVSEFFPGFENNFGADTNRVTNSTTVYGLHTLSLSTTNLSFSVTGFGTETPRTVAGVPTNIAPAVIKVTGAGHYMLNVGDVTNPVPSNILTAPAWGRFTVGGGLLRTNH